MIKDFFKRYPWVWFIVIALILFIGYKLYVYFTVTRPQNANYNATVTSAQTELTTLASQGINPSYPKEAYGGMANDLQTTFTGCGLDWSGVVVPTFQKMKNDADVYALISNYGVRTFDECGWGSFTGDLHAALVYKTGGVILTVPNITDIFTVASIENINKILEQNGIKYAKI